MIVSHSHCIESRGEGQVVERWKQDVKGAACLLAGLAIVAFESSRGYLCMESLSLEGIESDNDDQQEFNSSALFH